MSDDTHIALKSLHFLLSRATTFQMLPEIDIVSILCLLLDGQKKKNEVLHKNEWDESVCNKPRCTLSFLLKPKLIF
jgi:hypothetical protein